VPEGYKVASYEGDIANINEYMDAFKETGKKLVEECKVNAK